MRSEKADWVSFIRDPRRSGQSCVLVKLAEKRLFDTAEWPKA
jgi:hypothetical protein